MKKSMLIGIAAVPILALSACSGGAADPSPAAPSVSAGPATLTKVTAGVIPIVDSAPIWLGKSKGFFEDEGLDLDIQTGSGGGALLPGVVAGSYDFAMGTTVSVMLARDKALDIEFVSNEATTAGAPKSQAVVVPKDSPIKTAADLAGKTVSVLALNSTVDVTIRAMVDEDGGDSATVKFVEIPPPSTQAAVESKQVDAGWMLSPFLEMAVANGDRVITYNFSEFSPNFTLSGYFTMTETVKNKPDMVKAFAAALGGC